METEHYRIRPRHVVTHVIAVLASLCIVVPSSAQQTIGLLAHTPQSLDNGYVLFSPLASTTTYLIDKCGKTVHTWPSAYRPNYSVYLEDDGSILRPGISQIPDVMPPRYTACTERISWDGIVLWRYSIPDTTLFQNHDIARLPNGNILVVCFEMHTNAEAAALGRDTSRSHGGWTSSRIVEIKPVGSDGGEIVWQWRPNDHLIQDRDPSAPNYGVVADHPQLLNVNYNGNAFGFDDWLHINAVTYNAELDQVMINSHNFSEFWVVDHSTTMEEAASHTGGRHGIGGDIMWRWGNPAAYNRGSIADQKLFGQHNAQWIPNGYPHAGKILVFNNGLSRPSGRYSSVEIIAPPMDSEGNYDTSILPMLPVKQDWIYTDSPREYFYSGFISGMQMLPNGNILICSGECGHFFEIDSTGTKTWRYINPVNDSGPMRQGSLANHNAVFRCSFYPSSSPAFARRALTPGMPIEQDPLNYDCNITPVATGVVPIDALEHEVFAFPNPASSRIALSVAGIVESIALYDRLGNLIKEETNVRELATGSVPDGTYVLVVTNNGVRTSRLVSILR